MLDPLIFIMGLMYAIAIALVSIIIDSITIKIAINYWQKTSVSYLKIFGITVGMNLLTIIANTLIFAMLGRILIEPLSGFHTSYIIIPISMIIIKTIIQGGILAYSLPQLKPLYVYSLIGTTSIISVIIVTTGYVQWDKQQHTVKLQVKTSV